MRLLPLIVLAAASCGAQPSPAPTAPPVPPAPWPAEIDVERLHTIGDLPPAASTVVVAIARDGAVSVDGTAMDAARMRQTLKDRAWPAGARHGPSDVSATNVLIAADRDAPWQPVRQALEGAAIAGEARIFFAARPVSGDEPGAVASFLPVDSSTGRPADPPPVEVRIRFRADDGARDPAQLYDGFRAVLGKRPAGGTAFTLDVAGSTPAGIVLRTCDVLWLAGADVVEFAFAKDAPLVPGESARWLTADGITPSDVPADLPSPPRVRGAFAGSAETRRSHTLEREAPALPK